MIMVFTLVLSLIFVFAFSECFAAKLCVPGMQTPCRCVLDDRTVIDLSTVGLVGSPLFSYIPVPARQNDNQVVFEDSGLYSYNPCYPFTITERRSTTDFKNHPCVDVAACRLSPGKSDGTPPELHAIGFQNTAEFYKTSNRTYIHYTVPGYTKNLTVELICNETIDHELYVSHGEGEHLKDNVDMVFTSKCACPNGCATKEPDNDTKKGLSTGSILLITFFVILLVYLGLGVLRNFCNGAQGKEMLPNVAFWNELPKLIIEGFIYTCSCFSRRKTYGEV